MCKMWIIIVQKEKYAGYRVLNYTIVYFFHVYVCMPIINVNV